MARSGECRCTAREGRVAEPLSIQPSLGTGWTGLWWGYGTGVGAIASLDVDAVVRTHSQEVLTAPYTVSTPEAVCPFIA